MKLNFKIQVKTVARDRVGDTVIFESLNEFGDKVDVPFPTIHIGRNKPELLGTMNPGDVYSLEFTKES